MIASTLLDKSTKVLLNHLDAIIICLDVKQRILFFNQKTEDIFKKRPKLNKNIVNFCNETGFATLGHKIKTLLKNNNNDFCLKEIIQEPTASTLQLNFSYFKDEHTSTGFTIITGFIITFPKKLDETYSTIYYFNNLINNIPHLVFWKNKKSIFLGCNKEFAKSINISSPSDIVGKSDYDMPWTREQSEKYIKDDRLVMQSGLPKLNYEERQLDKIMLVSKVPIYAENHADIIGLLCIYADITDRKMAEIALREAKEKAEEGNRVKTEFIANMSHDIRTPVTGVISMAEILEKHATSEEQRHYSKMVQSSGEQLLQLLNDILEVISVENAKEDDLKFEYFDLKNSVKHLSDLLQPSFQAKKIELKIEVDPAFPPAILTDRIKLERILLNIISNAHRFTSNGYVKLSIKILSVEKDMASIQFSIADTGIGIAKNQISKIFERFYRITPSFQGKYVGHGIGLYIVKKYITLLGGKISVRSSLGKGTTFTFNIKAAISDHLPQVKTSKAVPETIKLKVTPKIIPKIINDEEKNFKVLFVEDDLIAQRTADYYFRTAGIQVTIVADAETAYTAARSNGFDLIITDIGLPGINGNEFIVMYRYWEKIAKKAPVPIISLSAHISPDSKKESLLAGANQVLTKPLNEQKIAAIKKKFLHEPLKNVKTPKKKVSKKNDNLDIKRYSLFDESDALSKLGDDKEVLKELLVMLVNQTIPEALTTTAKLNSISDLVSLQRLGHQLKGAALYCSTIRLGQAAHQVEQHALSGNNELTEKLRKELLVVLQDTKNEVEKYLAKL